MEPINPSQLMRKYDSLNLLPEDFQDPRDCEPMVNPILHIACGKSAEEASIRECLEFNGRCVSCNEQATIEQFVPNRNLRSVIEEFPGKILSVLDRQEWEVNGLRAENSEQVGRIDFLLEENTNLTGRVSDLTHENIQVVFERDNKSIRKEKLLIW